MKDGGSLVDRITPKPRPHEVVAAGAVVATMSLPGVTGVWWLVFVALPAYALIWWAFRTDRIRTGQVFENLTELTAATGAGNHNETLPGVTLVSPARNEEAGLETAVRSLAAIRYPVLEVIVVDDHSTDATPAILDRLAEAFPRIRVLHDPPAQAGWLGKANAVRHALAHATIEAEWLLFTDADVVFHPQAVRRAVVHAQEEGLDFLTCLPRLDTGSLTEKLLLPGMWRRLITHVPHRHLNDPDALPVGIGAFMLVRRKTYSLSGGHGAHAAYHAEDALLAGAIKSVGGRVGVAWTPDLLRIRLYRGWRDLRPAFVRKGRVYGDDNILYPLRGAVTRLLPQLLPLPLSLCAVAHQVYSGTFSIFLSLYALVGCAVYIELVRSFDQIEKVTDMPRWAAWLHPIGAPWRAWICLETILRCLLHTRVSWRGRAEPDHSTMT
ncbi:MAG: glycosyltransferase [Nitrospiraceae bacterium]|nr:glycosyltransferase [Nitrospiraceae bacterium]